jgi:hypothetical protein
MSAVPGLPPETPKVKVVAAPPADPSVIPFQLPEAKNLSAPGFTPLAAQIASGALLEPATAAILERIITKALTEPNGATKLATLMLDRSLPPSPSRADVWWMEQP